MIEPIMIFGIGFLVASLCGLLLIPLVHNRAVRLTKKRLEAAAPLSMAELQADKDQLRAEFAMSTRRLELLIDHLKSENSSQFAELGKKTDAINLFKAEINEKAAEIHALQLSQNDLREQLRATQEDLATKIRSLAETERALAGKQSEVGKLAGDINEHALAADSHRVEIIALHAQVEALKSQIVDLNVKLNAAQMVEADLRAKLEAAKQDTDAGSAKERAENAALRERINDIAAEIAHLTIALEGPQSPIGKLLAGTVEAQGAGNGANGGNGGGPVSAAGATSQPARNLSDRIRALQSRALRQPTTS